MRLAAISTAGSIAAVLAGAPDAVRANVTCDHVPEGLKGAFAHADDCLLVGRIFQLTLETARLGSAPSTWKSGRSGASGSMQVLGNVADGGRLCRTFKMSVTVDGKTTEAEGKACRVGDSWQLSS